MFQLAKLPVFVDPVDVRQIGGDAFFVAPTLRCRQAKVKNIAALFFVRADQGERMPEFKIEVRAVITFKIKFVSEDRLDPNIRQPDCETKSNFRKSTWGCLAGMNPFAASGVE